MHKGTLTSPLSAATMNTSTKDRSMQTTITSTDGQTTPVWITYLNEFDCDQLNLNEGLRETSGDTMYEPGYYWAVCFPGCIPDSEFYGPFASESEAESDAEEHLNW